MLFYCQKWIKVILVNVPTTIDQWRKSYLRNHLETRCSLSEYVIVLLCTNKLQQSCEHCSSSIRRCQFST
jgi:hypothetical protein